MLNFSEEPTPRSAALLVVGLLSAVGLVVPRMSAQNGQPAQMPTDISGEWTVVTHEDQPAYAAGGELGDYTGLPINAAERQRAESWDAGIESQPERQAHAHPIQYISNNRGPNRILKILDPVTQVQVAYALAGSYGRADRVVWLDGRPHPSDYSEHTADGFSTGVWEGNALVVTTTHLRDGYISRNGVTLSAYEKMVEHFIRHGLYMAVFMSIDDPIYLEEPEIRTYTEVWNPAGTVTYVEPFDSDELANKPLGWVPFFPLGTKHSEFAESRGLPFEVTQGGAATLYPEYQLKVQQLLKDVAVKEAGTVAKKPALNGAAASDPLLGTWELDRAKSTFLPDTDAATLESRTMILEQLGSAIHHSVVTRRGSENGGFLEGRVTVEYTFKYDGKDVPVIGASGLGTVSLRRIDKNTVERMGKVQGQTVETQSWQLSSDGKTLTITTRGTLHDSGTPGAMPYSSTQIFERQ